MNGRTWGRWSGDRWLGPDDGTRFLQWMLDLPEEYRAWADRETSYVIWSDTTLPTDANRAEMRRVIMVRVQSIIRRVERVRMMEKVEGTVDWEVDEIGQIIATMTDEEWLWATKTFPPHTSTVYAAEKIRERRAEAARAARARHKR